MEQLGLDYNNDDTICAVSTPAGMGGIAVVRVSGRNAIAYVMKSWRGKDLAGVASHTLHLGRIVDSDGETLDEVVAAVFRAPNSFTGEDVVELSCHGSIYIQRQLVALLIDNGCRAATGGEFTRRAFSNRRLDLSQAEAVADVIAGQSRASHRVAMSQMRGGFSRMLSALREKLLEFVSLMELELDFSEEEVEFADRERLTALAEEILATISHLADSFATGNAIKNGYPVAIIGQPNAGKSTLLNRLLRDDKALVSEISGTTRDVIEDTIVIGGLLFRFIDTAGIRDTSDAIETMGIELAFRKIDQADIVLWMIDATRPLEETRRAAEEIIPHLEGKRVIAVINKVDATDTESLTETEKFVSELIDAPQIRISAREGVNLNSLEEQLVDYAGGDQLSADAVVVTNARHYEALTRAREAISRAIQGLGNGLSGDFISQDIRECMHYLGEITGEITTHEILGSIFSRFCVGK